MPFVLFVVVLAFVIAVSVCNGRFCMRYLEFHTSVQSTSVDHDVYDAILADFINDEEFNAKLHGSNVSHLVLYTKSKSWINKSFIHNYAIDTGAVIPLEVRDSLVIRNPKAKMIELISYHPKSVQVLLRSSGNYSNDFDRNSDAFACVVPTLPGYSWDGRNAVCFLSNELGDHPDIVCYTLRKTKTGWNTVSHYRYIYTARKY